MKLSPMVAVVPTQVASSHARVGGKEKQAKSSSASPSVFTGYGARIFSSTRCVNFDVLLLTFTEILKSTRVYCLFRRGFAIRVRAWGGFRGTNYTNIVCGPKRLSAPFTWDNTRVRIHLRGRLMTQEDFGISRTFMYDWRGRFRVKKYGKSFGVLETVFCGYYREYVAG